jgi:hypothetical protein
VPEGGQELVFPARDGLAGAVAAAGVMVDMPAARGALGVRAGVGGGVDGELQPLPRWIVIGGLSPMISLTG